MKKFFMMLVMLFVCMVGQAQLPMNLPIAGFRNAGKTAYFYNGQEAYIGNIPCYNVFEKNLTIQENINKHLQRVYESGDQEEWIKQSRIYGNAMMNGAMMNGAYVGGAYVGGGYNAGSVYGNHGYATFTDVTKKDMLLFDDATNISFDGNKVYYSGNPLTTLARVYEFFAGKSKKTQQQVVYVDMNTGRQYNHQQMQQQMQYQQPMQTRAAQSHQTTNGGYTNGQVVRDANGNLYTINNGVLVPVQQMQQTRQSQQQPAQVRQQYQQTNYGGGVATTPVYNVAGDF